MAKYWIIPRVGDKELLRVGHQLASCSLINSYVHPPFFPPFLPPSVCRTVSVALFLFLKDINTTITGVLVVVGEGCVTIRNTAAKVKEEKKTVVERVWFIHLIFIYHLFFI